MQGTKAKVRVEQSNIAGIGTLNDSRKPTGLVKKRPCSGRSVGICVVTWKVWEIDTSACLLIRSDYARSEAKKSVSCKVRPQASIVPFLAEGRSFRACARMHCLSTW
jgi:hypothetical protein